MKIINSCVVFQSLIVVKDSAIDLLRYIVYLSMPVFDWESKMTNGNRNQTQFRQAPNKVVVAENQALNYNLSRFLDILGSSQLK